MYQIALCIGALRASQNEINILELLQMGAPIGNTNAAGTEKPFRDAITRACKQEDGKRLRRAAELLLDLAAQGESWAIKELADRLDGKPVANVDATVRGNLASLLASLGGDTEDK